MKLWGILKKVGSVALTASTGGAAGPILAAINAVLPSGEQLPENATGDQAMEAIEGLPPSERAAIMDKQFDVEIAGIQSWTSIQEALAVADATGSSTRPQIAYMMAWLVVLSAAAIIAALTAAIVTNDVEMVKALMDAWPFILAILGTPAALLRAYFGMRTDEKKARYNTAAGHPAQGIAGAIMGKWLNKG
jgi:hypothetical protein